MTGRTRVPPSATIHVPGSSFGPEVLRPVFQAEEQMRKLSSIPFQKMTATLPELTMAHFPCCCLCITFPDLSPPPLPPVSHPAVLSLISGIKVVICDAFPSSKASAIICKNYSHPVSRSWASSLGRNCRSSRMSCQSKLKVIPAIVELRDARVWRRRGLPVLSSIPVPSPP